jgi:hypothetical protein
MRLLYSCFFSSAMMACGGCAGVETQERVMFGDPVDRLFQASGETGQQFIIRTAQRLRVFTNETGFEASGSFCHDSNGRMGIQIYTWKAHFSSPVLRGCPLETPNIGDFIHSHPEPGRYQVTEQDVVASNWERKWTKAKCCSHTETVTRANAGIFSKFDYEVGPGYLVSEERVFYQHGPGTAVRIATLP